MVMTIAIRVVAFDELVVPALGVWGVFLCLKDLIGCGYRSGVGQVGP